MKNIFHGVVHVIQVNLFLKQMKWNHPSICLLVLIPSKHTPCDSLHAKIPRFETPVIGINRIILNEIFLDKKSLSSGFCEFEGPRDVRKGTRCDVFFRDIPLYYILPAMNTPCLHDSEPNSTSRIINRCAHNQRTSWTCYLSYYIIMQEPQQPYKSLSDLALSLLKLIQGKIFFSGWLLLTQCSHTRSNIE